jgi:uncharacterized membrane protein YuzA (DUF378 family)
MSLLKILCTITTLIALIGAINWAFYDRNYNLIAKITTDKNVRSTLYWIVAVCGMIALLCQVVSLFDSKKHD